MEVSHARAFSRTKHPVRLEFGYVFPKLVALAEISISPPVTNAWPERGASALKRLKTRFRSGVNTDFLNALNMQITLNGPPVQSPKEEEVIQSSVRTWLTMNR